MDLLSPNQIDCFFFLENEPTVGSSMEMEVTLPQEIAGSATAKVHCQGKVVAVEKEKVGGRTRVFCSIEVDRVIPAAADVEMGKENLG